MNIQKEFFYLMMVLSVLFGQGCHRGSQMLFLQPQDPRAVFHQEQHRWDRFPLNILFVIESSQHLVQHQESLTRHITSLIRPLYDKRPVIDFQIKITLASSESIQGYYSNVFTNATYAHLFEGEGLNLDAFYLQPLFEIGRLFENRHFFDAVSWSLTSDQGILPFDRKDAHLLIVFVGRLDQSQNMSATELKDLLMELKNYDKDKISTLFLQTPLGQECSALDVHISDPINEFVDFFDGIKVSLCDDVNSMNLLNLARRMVYQNAVSLPLKRLPILETVRFCYGPYLIPQDVDKGWSYFPQDNKIVLGWNPEIFNQPISLEQNGEQQQEAGSINEDDTSVANPHPYCMNEEVALEDVHEFSLTYTSAVPVKEREEEVKETEE